MALISFYQARKTWRTSRIRFCFLSRFALGSSPRIRLGKLLPVPVHFLIGSADGLSVRCIHDSKLRSEFSDLVCLVGCDLNVSLDVVLQGGEFAVFCLPRFPR